MWESIRRMIGVELNIVTWKERVISTVGGLVAILLVALVSQHFLGLSGAALVIASMGSSAVLLFAVPHGPLSQPWPLLGGHLVSALIGITCARYISFMPLAAACAVGVSIGLMHQFKCIHPPGGATAMTAVIGSQAVHDLGYMFAWTPVMINALLLLVCGVAFNAFFPWRRYPTILSRKPPAPEKPEISHEEVVAALRTMDSFVDISEEDLVRLVQILSQSKAVRR